jgi:hypothetical protein
MKKLREKFLEVSGRSEGGVDRNRDLNGQALWVDHSQAVKRHGRSCENFLIPFFQLARIRHL